MSTDLSAPVEASRGDLVLRLIAANEELQWAVRLAGETPAGYADLSARATDRLPSSYEYLRHLKPMAPGETSLQVLRRFTSLYADELATVRAVRNAVVHAQDVGLETLAGAVRIAELVLKLLRQNAPT